MKGDNFTYGASVEYVCERGFRLEGEDVRTCIGDGEWSGRRPECTVIFCQVSGPITLKLVDRITTQIDNSKIPINIFLDLSKAFDTVDHNISLDKLKYYGLEGPTLKLFDSHLTDRKQ